MSLKSSSVDSFQLNIKPFSQPKFAIVTRRHGLKFHCRRPGESITHIVNDLMSICSAALPV